VVRHKEEGVEEEAEGMASVVVVVCVYVCKCCVIFFVNEELEGEVCAGDDADKLFLQS
jgi:hypothetical protein